MYSRFLKLPSKQSCFLFGPRGTGKTSYLREKFPDSTFIDLLEDETYNTLLANPGQLSRFFEKEKKRFPIVIDEVQKIPALLDEVHRLIETEKLKFILTGSSSRKLKKNGVNLLAGRALSYSFFPLTAQEMGGDFNLKKALQFGLLPMAVNSKLPGKYLQSYAKTYLKEEIQLEGLTRNLQAFSRFLQAASFSQGGLLVPARIAEDCSIERKVVENYFSILSDLMLSVELPVFTKRAKRDLIAKRKFYFFDAGVYRILRPRGPLDSESEINGLSLETLVLQELRALNQYWELDYEISFWHTRDHKEVDFVLYGRLGFKAIEVKMTSKARREDLESLLLFQKDYPEAQLYLIYGGDRRYKIQDIELIPAQDFFANPQDVLRS